MKHPVNVFVHMVWIHQIVWQTRRIVKLKICQKRTLLKLHLSFAHSSSFIKRYSKK